MRADDNLGEAVSCSAEQQVSWRKLEKTSGSFKRRFLKALRDTGDHHVLPGAAHDMTWFDPPRRKPAERLVPARAVPRERLPTKLLPRPYLAE